MHYWEVIFAVELNEVGEDLNQVDEEPCTKVLNIISCELKPIDEFFVLNPIKLWHLSNLVKLYIELLKVLELLDAF